MTVAAAVTLTACSTSSTPGTTGSTASSTNSVADTALSSAEGTPSSAALSPHNDADVMFAQEMMAHHRGAIEMADLAPSRAGSQEVKDLAAEIKAAQSPEIEQMTAWLTEWGVSTGTDMGGGHSMTPGMTMSTSADDTTGATDPTPGMDMTSAMTTGSQMPGMMSADQMAQLEAASGTAFDKLFLELMITHHQGALTMAEMETANGAYPDALALAQSITASQTAEIATMQQMLALL